MTKIKDMDLKQIRNFIGQKNYWIGRYEDEETLLSKKVGLMTKRLDIKETDIDNEVTDLLSIFENEDPTETDIKELLTLKIENKYMEKFIISLISVKIKLIKEQKILSYAQKVLTEKEETEEETEVQG